MAQMAQMALMAQKHCNPILQYLNLVYLLNLKCLVPPVEVWTFGSVLMAGGYAIPVTRIIKVNRKSFPLCQLGSRHS